MKGKTPINQRHGPTSEGITNSAKNLPKNNGCLKIKFRLSTSKGLAAKLHLGWEPRVNKHLPPQIKF